MTFQGVEIEEDPPVTILYDVYCRAYPLHEGRLTADSADWLKGAREGRLVAVPACVNTVYGQTDNG